MPSINNYYFHSVIIRRGVDVAGTNKRKYVAIAKTTSATASRDIADLIEKGCISQVEGSIGRGTSYTVVL